MHERYSQYFKHSRIKDPNLRTIKLLCTNYITLIFPATFSKSYWIILKDILKKKKFLVCILTFFLPRLKLIDRRLDRRVVII